MYLITLHVYKNIEKVFRMKSKTSQKVKPTVRWSKISSKT
jgi:hypothetical protein